MNYRKDKYGNDLSLLGFGTMRLPVNDGVIDQEQVQAMVDYAMEHGVNYFDTSPAYCRGKSEEGAVLLLLR